MTVAELISALVSDPKIDLVNTNVTVDFEHQLVPVEGYWHYPADKKRKEKAKIELHISGTHRMIQQVINDTAESLGGED